MKFPFVCSEMCDESYSFSTTVYALLRACCLLFGNYNIVYLFLEEQGDRYIQVHIDNT